MKTDHIALACPHCMQPVIQLAANTHPIQEQRLSCPSCTRTTVLGKLTTDNGESFQTYLRTFFRANTARRQKNSSGSPP